MTRPLRPPDRTAFTWSGPSPTFTWSATCDLSYQVELSNGLDFEHPALNHGSWTAIGNFAKDCGGAGKVYWRVVGYGPGHEVVRSDTRSIEIEWPSRH